jgi:hypothetical protein
VTRSPSLRTSFPSLAIFVAAAAALALLAAGCGGSPRSQASRVGSTATAALAFARCARSHGVPNFPDPNSQGTFPLLTTQSLGVSKQTMIGVKHVCGHLLANAGSAPQETPQQQRIQLADALSFARCMRTHGVTRFPDPSAQSGLTVAMVEAQGIDVHSAAFLQVVQTCLPASHGGLTLAKVREAINNAGG